MLQQLDTPALKKESSELLKMASPIIISQLAQMSMGAIDTVMAGNLSTNALASISIASNLLMPLLVFFMGLFMALNPLVAQANGAKRYNKLGEYLRHGIYVAFLITLPSVFIINHLEPVMQMIGVQPSIVPVVSDYLQAVSWGILPLFLFMALRSVNEGLFSTTPIMFISLAAIPFNIMLNYIFMYGYLGIPSMGAVGLGYATAIVWCLIFSLLLLYTLFAKKYQHLVFFRHFHKPDLQVFKEILVIGIPLSVTIGLEVLMFGAVGLFIGRFSINMIAAHQIALNFASLVFMVPLGLSIAVSARVGHAAGRNSATDLKTAAYLGIFYSVMFMLCALIVTLSITETIVAIYSNESSVIAISVQLLHMATIFMLFDGLQVSASGALRGMKDTIVPMYMSGAS